MSKRSLLALLPLLLLSAAAGAQEKAERPPKKAPTPLKVDVVFTKYQAEKKVGSVPYTLLVNADDRPTRLRMGIQVPLRYDTVGGKDVPGNVVYKSVGNNVDCSAERLDDGRFKLMCSLEQSSIYSMDADKKTAGPAGEGSLSPPLIRTFSSEASLILRDGQSMQYTMATDPVSGEVLKVDVTLAVVK